LACGPGGLTPRRWAVWTSMRDVAGAVATGVSFVCATCDHFWWGIERGLPHCKAHVDRVACGGPITGLAYPRYSGPLVGNLRHFCFATGEAAKFVICTKDGGEVGASDRGIELVQSYSVGGIRPRFISGERVDVKRG
jgi:hypothetical protein